MYIVYLRAMAMNLDFPHSLISKSHLQQEAKVVLDYQVRESTAIIMRSQISAPSFLSILT